MLTADMYKLLDEASNSSFIFRAKFLELSTG